MKKENPMNSALTRLGMPTQIDHQFLLNVLN